MPNLLSKTADASPSLDDVLYLVNDPGGTPSDRKATLENVLGAALAAMRALTPAADKFSYFDGASSAALADLSSLARTFLAQTTQANARAQLYAMQEIRWANYSTNQSGATGVGYNYDVSGGSATLTLPSAAASDAQMIAARLATAPGGNTLTIARAGSDTIEGATSLTLSAQNELVYLVADGSESRWLLVSDRRTPADTGGLTKTAAKSGPYTTAAGDLVVLDINGATHSDTFTANAATDFITFASFTPTDDDEFEFTTSGTLPAGLAANTRYYAKNSSGTTCQLVLVMGGSSVVNITSAGSGTHTAARTAFPVKLPASPADEDRVGFYVKTAHAVTTVRIGVNGKYINLSADSEHWRLLTQSDYLVLQFDSGANSWFVETDAILPLVAVASRTSNLTTGPSSQTKVGWETAEFDPAGCVDLSADTITARRGGKYNIFAAGAFFLSSTSASELRMSAKVTGATWLSQVYTLASAVFSRWQTLCRQDAYALAAGAYVEQYTYQVGSGSGAYFTTPLYCALQEVR